MKKTHSLFILGLIFSFFQSHQIASGGSTGGDCSGLVEATYYDPAIGGINGHCGTNAANLPEHDPCVENLDNFKNSTAKVVVVAVAQNGGSSDLFGGKYKATFGNERFEAIAVDKYAKSSDGKCKSDIAATKNAGSAVTGKKGTLELEGRVSGVQNPGREVQRAPGI